MTSYFWKMVRYLCKWILIRIKKMFKIDEIVEFARTHGPRIIKLSPIKLENLEDFTRDKGAGTTLGILLLIPAVLFTLSYFTLLEGFDGGQIAYFLGAESKFEVVKLIGWATGGLLAMFGLWIANRRAKAMEMQAEIANSDSREKRFRDGVTHLGHVESSVRLGGIYGLYQLAQDYWKVNDKKERSANIIDILCAHIRNTTRSEKYQDKHENQPSEEIESILDLLFRPADGKIFLRGTNDQIDLSRCLLARADLSFAQLQSANLSRAQLQGANLSRAQLRGANLSKAQLQAANLNEAQLQGANLDMAQLQRADLYMAQLQGATLTQAQLQEAKLLRAQLQDAFLIDAQLQGANLMQAQLQGAALIQAQLQGATLNKAQLQAASLDRAELQGANLDEAQLQAASLEMTALQAAILNKAQLQAANLNETQLQGVSPQFLRYDMPSFEDHIQSRVGCQSDFKNTIFSGGIKEIQIKKIANALKNQIRSMEQSHLPKNPWESRPEGIKRLLERITESMKQHLNKTPSHEPPSEAITEPYSQEDADRWIEEYKEATDPKNWGNENEKN